MSILKKRLWVALAGLMLWTGCSPASSSSDLSFLDTGPHAWIDAPLDNSSLPAAPYTVVFHGTDPDGVAEGELAVDGTVEASLPNPEPGSRLAAFQVEWIPPGPGEYLLSVRARNGQGGWSEPAEARVYIAGETPTPTETPTPEPSGPEFDNRTEPKQAYRGICSPNQVTFEVRVQAEETVQAVYVFLKLQDADSGTATPWNSGNALNPLGSGVFRKTIPTSSMPDLGVFSSAYLLYQFNAVGSDSRNFGNSPVFADVVINRCGIDLFPEPLHPLWGSSTPTPIIVK
jgi:hypothetical protein